MEFLDPEEKRAKTLKLFFSYSVAAVAIVSTTVVLSFVLQGADLFSRQIEQKNGLLFVDSKPVSANIYIDGQASKRTEARFVLPEARYSMKIVEDGYREWSKDIDVIGGQVRYHVYPKLFPIDIKTANISNYTEAPSIFTQSPDRKWLVLSPTNTQAILHKYNLDSPGSAPTQIVMPEDILTVEDLKTSKFEEVEWSSDSKNVLYKKTNKDGVIQYLVINIDKPAESINITKNLALKQTDTVTLKDQKYDKYYILDTQSKILRAANLKNGIEPKILAEGVVKFKYYGDNIIVYATTSGALEDELSVRVLKNNETYLLEPIARSDNVLLDVAVYENDWYYVASSESSKDVKLYLNPLSQTPNLVDGGVIKAQITLLIENPRFVSFSNNTRFMAAQSKTNFAVYDAELTRKYRYKTPVELPETGAKWMDGHRFSFASNNKVEVFEFDGQNKQTISDALPGYKTYYDKDYFYLYNLVSGADGAIQLQQSNLRATN